MSDKIRETILEIFADNAEASEHGDEHGYLIVREQHALDIGEKLIAALAQQPTHVAVSDGITLEWTERHAQPAGGLLGWPFFFFFWGGGGTSFIRTAVDVFARARP